MTKRFLVVLAIVAAAFLLGHFIGKGDGKRDAENDNFRVIQSARADTIRLVEERRVVDTVRIRVAEQHAAAAIVAFDSAAARVEAVADTSAVVPTSLVLPEIQTCRDMRDSLLVELDIHKVYERDDAAEIALQTRRGDLAEAQLKKQRPPRIGFKSGVVAGVAATAAATHPAAVIKAVGWIIRLVR